MNSTNIEARLYSVNVVCKMLGLCRTTLYERMKDGTIAFVQVGGVRRIPASEVDRIVGEAKRAMLA
jgi:excisionase family DNA binding protein